MANIKFYLGSPSKEVSLVFISVYCNDGRIRLSTGETVHTQYWNVAKQRATIKGYPSGIGTNSVLNSIQTNFDERSNILKATKQVLTKAIVESVLTHTRNQTDPDHDPTRQTFWQYFDSFLLRDRVTSDGLPIKKQSYTSYKVTYQRFKDFEKSKKLKIDFGNIDKNLLEKFKAFCYSKQNDNYKNADKIGLAPSTVQLTIKRLKTVLSEAVEDGYNVPPNHKKVKVKSVVVTEISLSEEELKTLYDFDFSYNNGYEKVRDLFLIGCYTMLRFSDYSKVSDMNTRQRITKDGKVEKYLHINTQKTGQDLYIPITPVVAAILKKYSGTLPKKFSVQIHNEYLKEIGKAAGFISKIKVVKYEQGQRVENIVEKWSEITSHTARRTGATMMYNSTKNIVLCMALMGHKKESQFLEYIRNDDTAKLQMLSDAFVNSGFGNITAPKKNHLSIVSKAV